MNFFRPVQTLALDSEAGFTFIELLTVVAIIGVLSAAASSQFRAYANQAYDARAESDLHKIIVAEESYFTDNEAYVACAGPECELQLDGIELSPNTEMVVTLSDDESSFIVEAYHPQGVHRYRFESEHGRMRELPLT